MRKILVIEYHPDLLKVMLLALTRDGYDITVAHNGIEGMELLNDSSRFDLVITDIRIDGADGNQVAQFMKVNKNYHETPIIAVTPYVEEAKSELFDAVLVKPFTMQDLRKAINSLL